MPGETDVQCPESPRGAPRVPRSSVCLRGARRTVRNGSSRATRPPPTSAGSASTPVTGRRPASASGKSGGRKIHFLAIYCLCLKRVKRPFRSGEKKNTRASRASPAWVRQQRASVSFLGAGKGTRLPTAVTPASRLQRSPALRVRRGFSFLSRIFFFFLIF